MNLRLRLKCLLFAGSLFPVAAFAGRIDPATGGNAWDLNAVGCGGVMFDVINSVSSTINDSSYYTLITSIAIIGIIVTALINIHTKPQKLLVYGIGLMAVVTAIKTMTININVYDPLNSTTRTATNVPAVIGLPAVITSKIGTVLTEKTETYFSYPSSGTANYVSRGGFNLATSIVRDSANMRISDPYLQASTVSFFQDCVIPRVASGDISTATVVSSANLWSDLSGTLACTAQSTFTTYFPMNGTSAQGNIVTCASACTALTSDLALHAPEIMKRSSSMFIESASPALINTLMTESLDYMSAGGITTTPAQTAIQNSLIAIWNKAYQNMAVMTGNSEILTSINIEQAKQAQKSGWAVTAELFKDMVGYIHAVLTCFSMALVILIIVAAVIPAIGGQIIKSYLIVLIWLALWQPALGIVNYLANSFALQELGGLIQTGFTIETHTVINERASKFIMVSNFLAASIPIFLWGLLKSGSMALTSYLERSFGTGNANKAADNMAHDTMSHGQMSFDNSTVGQHKHDSSHSYGANPAMASIATAGHGTVINGGGLQYLHSGSPVTKTITDKKQHAVSYSQSDVYSQIASADKTGSFSHQSMFTMMDSESNKLSDNRSFDSSGAVTEGSGYSYFSNVAVGYAYAQQYKEEAGTSDSSNAKLTAAAKISAELGANMKKSGGKGKQSKEQIKQNNKDKLDGFKSGLMGSGYSESEANSIINNAISSAAGGGASVSGSLGANADTGVGSFEKRSGSDTSGNQGGYSHGTNMDRGSKTTRTSVKWADAIAAGVDYAKSVGGGDALSGTELDKFSDQYKRAENNARQVLDSRTQEVTSTRTQADFGHVTNADEIENRVNESLNKNEKDFNAAANEVGAEQQKIKNQVESGKEDTNALKNKNSNNVDGKSESEKDFMGWHRGALQKDTGSPRLGTINGEGYWSGTQGNNQDDVKYMASSGMWGWHAGSHITEASRQIESMSGSNWSNPFSTIVDKWNQDDSQELGIVKGIRNKIDYNRMEPIEHSEYGTLTPIGVRAYSSEKGGSAAGVLYMGENTTDIYEVRNALPNEASDSNDGGAIIVSRPDHSEIREDYLYNGSVDLKDSYAEKVGLGKKY